MSTRRLILLGSTGSIGTQTVDVVEHINRLHAQGAAPFRLEVVGLAAGRNADVLASQAASLGVRDVALADEDSDLDVPAGTNVRRGSDAAERLVHEVDADVVLGAMVGIAGLPATLAAIERGTDVALANKETLVAAGEIVLEACRRTGAGLLPVDSEHSGVWQCLAARSQGHASPPFECAQQVRKIVLTASGGALRDKSLDEVAQATVEQALSHPTWDMGAKVTVDSASLTNKALELIEAHWLFGVGSDRLGVLVHPPSIVHAMVEFADGSVISQLGAPDMRTPIQFALTAPQRVEGCSDRIAWDQFGSLEFRQPDFERFPALRLGFEVIDAGGTSGAVFNAANEVAVEAFLDRRILFGRIGDLVDGALRAVGVSSVRTLADIHEADAAARRYVQTELG
ncbi:MAG: 1-deoxy-D-xylulose-5-phosphate reductoisomerase [Planctomycetota bacterium]